jgi:chromosome segregation ATPase
VDSADFYSFLTQLLNAPTLVGLGLLMLAAYFWFTKITSERTVGSEFKELIGQLQSQITELHDQLKEERVARAVAEKEKYDAIGEVGQLSSEIKILKQQITVLQQTVDQLRIQEETIIKQTSKFRSN